MPTYGRFEVVQEIHRGGLGHVSRARASDEGVEPRYAVKVFEVSVGLAGVDDAKAALNRFLESAATQARVASSSPDSHWAPVHDSGTADESAFYVTDHYPGSGDRIARGRVKLTSHALHRIMSDAVTALKSLEAVAGRGHGNLKSANFLFTTEGDPATGSVVLVDPAPTDRLPDDGARRDDFRALGTVLYELVLHQRLSSRTAWPLPEDAAWARLGRDGARWRELCSRLLAPTVEHGFESLDDLALALDALTPRSRSRVPALVAVIAVLVAVAAGGYWWINGGGGGSSTPAAEFDQAVWAKYCDEYEWYDAVKQTLEENTQHPDVQAFLATVNTLTPEDPASIHEQGSVLRSQLAGLSVGNHKTTDGIERTLLGQRQIESFEEALTQWSLLQSLSDRSAEYQERGWVATAAHVAKIASPDAFVGDARETSVAISRAIQMDEDTDDIDALWSEVEATGATLSASGDDVLATFMAYAVEQPAGAVPSADGGLDDLKNRVEQVRALGDRLVGRLDDANRNGADLRAFRASPDHPDAPTTFASAEPYTQWMQRVRTFFSLDPAGDPRDAKWTDDITSLTQSLDRVEKDAAAALSATDRSEIAELRTRVGELSTTEKQLASLSWIQLHRQQIKDGSDAITEDLLGLRSEVTSLMNRLLTDLDTRIAGTEADRISSSDAINDQWNKLRASIEGVSRTDSAIYRTLDCIEGSREILETLSASYPSATVALPDGLMAGQGEWIGAINQALASRREADLATIIDGVDWSAESFVKADVEAQIVDAQAQRASDFDAFRTEAVAFVDVVFQLEQALDLAYAPNEVVPSAGKTPLETLADAQALPFWQTHNADVVAVVDRLRATEQIEQSTSRADVVRSVVNADPGASPELIRTGWQILTSMPSDGTSGALDDLRRASNQMLAMTQTLSDADRRTALESARAASLPRLWMTHFDAVRDQNALDRAFNQAPTFGFSRDQLSELSPAARYNFLLKELLIDAPSIDETQIPTRVQRFVDETADVRSSLSIDGQFWDSLSMLVVAAPTNAGVNDLQSAGPGKVGWSWGGGTEVRPAYAWEGHRIQFAQVEIPATGEMVYVATEELPVGLAIDWINDARNAQAFTPVTDVMRARNFPTPGLPVAHRFGPQAWMFTGREKENLRRGSSWLPNSWKNIQAPTMRGVSKVSPDIADSSPTDLSPLQAFPPDAAAMIADRLGCRLPTSDEWQAALAMSRSSGEGRANRRDPTWATQFAYIKGLRAGTPPRTGEWPSIGGFRTSATSPPELDSQPASSASDGVLWFEDVSSGGGQPFNHLIGNVAEYVTSQPIDRGDRVGSMSYGESQGLKGQLQVIGASAMTPPDVQPERPYPLPSVTDEVSKFGFADVGIRLAFPAPSVSLNRQLSDALSRATFAFK